MSLLEQLQSALNKLYDGNTITAEEPKQNLYYCDICRDFVTEDKWNEKHQCCYQCYWKDER